MFRKVIFKDTIKLMVPVAAAMTLLFSATTAGLCTELAQALERKRPGSSENDKKEELKPLPSAVKKRPPVLKRDDPQISYLYQIVGGS